MHAVKRKIDKKRSRKWLRVKFFTQTIPYGGYSRLADLTVQAIRQVVNLLGISKDIISSKITLREGFLQKFAAADRLFEKNKKRLTDAYVSRYIDYSQ
jgi:hypothetical protein